MQVDLKALNDNKSGIGTKVEIYAGALYQKFEIGGTSGYLGRNSGMLLVGLGSEKVTDAVRLLWPTGVPQDEIDLAANKTQKIGELDRRGQFVPGAVFVEWKGIRIHCGHDWAGRGGALDRAGATGCARPGRVLESAGEERKSRKMVC